MQYSMQYESFLGKILMASDGTGITGLWFYGQARFAGSLDSKHVEKEVPVFDKTKRWLDIYFSGKEPGFSVPVHLLGTDFQMNVWEILRTIPYGKTTSYAAVAQKLAEDRGKKNMSAQAVGGALARNPVSILVPCHRVIKTDGKLGGYAAGEDRKASLLQLEQRE